MRSQSSRHPYRIWRLAAHLPGWVLFALYALLTAGCGGAGGGGQDGNNGAPDAAIDDEADTIGSAPSCTSDEDCADDNACTWKERCNAGACEARFVGCDDGNECTNDGCEPASGCTFTAHEGLCDDGNPCTLQDRCKDGACFFLAQFDCDDGDPCTRDQCDPQSGGCSFLPSDEEQLCDDGNACTDNDRCEDGACLGAQKVCPPSQACRLVACEPERGCVAVNLEGACSDGSLCTLDDVCVDGDCVGGAPRDCDDGNPCTTDTCDASLGCDHAQNTLDCDDGVACTGGDACEDGVCVSGASVCDDDNPCTLDECAPSGECLFVPQVGPCDDGKGCTTGDTCIAGVCTGGTDNPCDDGDICTTDACIPGPLGGATCQNLGNPACLEVAPIGQSFGFVEIDWDSAQLTKADCFGGAASTVGYGGTLDGEGACTWSAALSQNKAVKVVIAASSAGLPKKVLTPEGLVDAQPLEGTATLSGAMAGTLALTGAITVASGQAIAYLDAAGVATSPPAATPKPVSLRAKIVRTDESLGLCCTPQGFCAPAGAALCDDLGGTATDPDQGECCVKTAAGTQCAPSPPGACEATPGASYQGPVAEACCTLGGCAMLDAASCIASGGSPAPGNDCSDGNADGFADACPAPAGCGLPDDVVSCAVAGGALNVDIAGGFPISLKGSWAPAGANTWTATGSSLSLQIPGGESVPLPILGGSLTATCAPFVQITGSVGLPNFSGVDVLGSGALGATTPSLSLGFGLGQDLAFLDAPLADCASYLFLSATSELSFSPGGGLPGFAANDGSQVTIAVDPFDPAFFVRAQGSIVSGPSAGFVDDVGFGLSRQGKLTWSTAVPIPPALGLAPKGAKLSGHVFQRGRFGVIPIPNSPVQVFIDGEVVASVGPLVDAAEAVLVGFMGGDWGDIEAALQQAGGGLSAAKLLSELRYGANANSIDIEAGPVTIHLLQGSLVFEESTIRFAAKNFAPGELFDGAPAALSQALEALGIQQVSAVAGFVDPSEGFSIELTSDLQFGPALFSGTKVLVTYDGSDFSVSVDLPALSFDLLGWLESFKDFLDCDFEKSEAGCSIGGYPVGNIRFDTSGGGVGVALEAQLPLGIGKVEFSASVGDDGDFTLVGQATVPMSLWTSVGATVILTQEGVRVIGTFDDFSTSIVLDGILSVDGTYTLMGQGELSLFFATLDAQVTLSNASGPTLLGVLANYDTPFGAVDVEGNFELGRSGLEFDLLGTAELDVLGFQKLDAMVRVTNQGAVGIFVELDFDVPLLDAQLDGELSEGGGFALAGTGALKIPGFSNLATAEVEVSSSKGVFIASEIGLPSATLDFSGAITPSGFLFKGENQLSLLGFSCVGQATFSGSPSGATLGWAGKLNVGANKIDLAGTFASNGQFSFTGKSNVQLFGYNLAQANVVFSNATGLELTGVTSILGANFTLKGKIQPNLDFELASQANAKLSVAGASGSFGLNLKKSGAVVTAKGSGAFTFLGITANGGFFVSSSGAFSGWGSVGVDWDKGPLSLEGSVSLSVWNNGFSAWAKVEACADYWFDNACVSTGGSINSSGDVCIDFPIAGEKCIDVF
jgi:hypothetical protein